MHKHVNNIQNEVTVLLPVVPSGFLICRVNLTTTNVEQYLATYVKTSTESFSHNILVLMDLF